MIETHNVFLFPEEIKKFKRSKNLNLNKISGLNIDPEINHIFSYYDKGGG